MLRVFLVAGLTLSTWATAEARGFRLPLRGWSHAPAVGKPHISPVSAGLAAASLSRAGAKLMEPAKSSDSSENRPAVAPSPVAQPAALARSAEPRLRTAAAGDWCQDGTIVGSGKGFCVISRATY